MPTKTAVHTFKKGMVKDLDRSLLSNDAYLDASNYRIVTSVGESTGALENIEGNHLINSSVNAICPDGHRIVGSCLLRDTLVLFTTNNTSSAPTAGNSRIIAAQFTEATETLGLTLTLYDDSLNGSTGYLKFSSANPIKVIGRYETPNIQKIYWTDGYNNVRYADVMKYLTVSGEAYTINDYMAPEMFEFLPLFTSTKPTLSDMIGGHLMGGMVQYSYQLYRLNGAETSFSPVSNLIHIVNDSDFKTNTLSYQGDSESIETGKGCRISIVNNNTGYNRLRLIRIHYPSLNAVPTINVVTEVEIDTNPSTVIINDVGNSIDNLTIDEFNIASTELFKCEDLATKNNRLFAANINKTEFTVGDFDCRAVRFRNYTDPAPGPTGTDVTSPHMFFNNNSTITFTPGGTQKTYQVTVSNFKTEMVSEIPSNRTITGITNNITTTRTIWDCIEGIWYDTYLVSHNYNAIGNDCTFNVVSYNAGTGELVFSVTSSGMDLWGADWDYVDIGVVYDLIFTYTYTTPGTPATFEDAVVWDGASMLNIAKPVDPTLAADWVTARWTTALFPDTHDAVNKFNDTDNDSDASYAFKYQADCITLGAEGPNVKIDFESDSMILDNSNVATTFSDTVEVDGSYSNFASPWNGGNLSWQRDEVYRLFVVWENNRGQRTSPQWIIDLRMPSLHDEMFLNSTGTAVWPYILGINVPATGTILTHILRPRIFFKSLPTGAVSCQIHRVKRERSDRSVVTQCLAVPTHAAVVDIYSPYTIDQVNLATDGVELVKLVSPEINITKNITRKANDYLEYVTHFTGGGVLSTTSTTDDLSRLTYKLIENTRVAYAANTRTDISEAVAIVPGLDHTASDYVILDGKKYNNYLDIPAFPEYARGSSGLLVSYDNTSWSAEGVALCLVNYKSKVYGSQYGGNTYENRQLNITVPCSDIINTAGIWNSVEGGDTFINYMDVSTLLYDIILADLTTSRSEVVYFPVESSINCDLRHDRNSQHLTYSLVKSALRQEYAGEHTFIDTVGPVTVIYSQEEDLYLYNTVYSQNTSVQNGISETMDTSNETEFDCLVKASHVKYNGETSDSWTKFGVNEEIEVDSTYGELTAIQNFNDRLMFWQEHGFGVLAVNDRSLISAGSTSQLVLGTGGVLDRYDYISSSVGTNNKFTIVQSQTGVYWFDPTDKSVYRFSDSLINLSKSKLVQSWFNNNYLTDSFVHGIYDSKYNEVIMTLCGPPGCIPKDSVGALYNWYAISDVRNIAASGWHVPTSLEWSVTFGNYLVSADLLWGTIKEIGFTYWNTPNTGATNELGFNLRGGGYRYATDGSFHDLLVRAVMAGDATVCPSFSYNSSNYSIFSFGANGGRVGRSVRLVKDATVLTNGQTGRYIGNDGKVYETVCIGTQEWLTSNLCETKYRTGDSITKVTDNTAWSVLSTGAYCWYNNVEPVYPSYTIVYNESTDSYTSFYSFTPKMYIPYINGYFSTCFTSNADSLYYHNSLIENRCSFYGTLYSSTIKLLFNEDYDNIKVFDNFFFASNTYNTSGYEQQNISFSNIRCYNALQNTGITTLTYGTNLKRDEREWWTFVPRNSIDVIYPTNVDILGVANLDTTRLYRDRMRDKFLIVDLTYTNSTGNRFVFPYFGLKYRLSYR